MKNVLWSNNMLNIRHANVIIITSLLYKRQHAFLTEKKMEGFKQQFPWWNINKSTWNKGFFTSVNKTNFSKFSDRYCPAEADKNRYHRNSMCVTFVSRVLKFEAGSGSFQESHGSTAGSATHLFAGLLLSHRPLLLILFLILLRIMM